MRTIFNKVKSESFNSVVKSRTTITTSFAHTYSPSRLFWCLPEEDEKPCALNNACGIFARRFVPGLGLVIFLGDSIYLQNSELVEELVICS